MFFLQYVSFLCLIKFKAIYPYRNYLGVTENPFAPIYETLFLYNINRKKQWFFNPLDAVWMHLVH